MDRVNRMVVRASQVGLVAALGSALWFGTACQKAAGSGDVPDHIAVDGKSGHPKGTYRVVADDTSGTPSDAESKLGGYGAPGPAPHRILYLNRKGGVYAPGPDDSGTHHSSVVDGVVRIAPYEKSDASWATLVSCVKDQFARYNVDVVDTDPGGKQHMEAVVGGSPADIGMSAEVGGFSPMNAACHTIERSVVFVFSKQFKDAQSECEMAAQTLGSSIGLDHEVLCQDTMSTQAGCGHKSFQDLAASCGDTTARKCLCGGATQNSVQFLSTRLGLKGGPVPPPPPSDAGVDDGGAPKPPPDDDGGAPPPVDDGGAPTPPDDGGVAPPPPGPGTDGPTITVVKPADGDTLAANSTIDITATIADKSPPTKVFLRWTIGGKSTDVDCASPPMEVTCEAAAGSYTWHIPVGSGPRIFSIGATDTAGKSAQTPDRHITLAAGGGGVTPPPPPPPPPSGGCVATIDGPTDGQSFSAGDTVQLRVNVTGCSPSDVSGVWRGPGGDAPITLKNLSGTTWGDDLDISGSAPSGKRSIIVNVSDGAGAKVTIERSLSIN